jgi:hypothetical protein
MEESINAQNKLQMENMEVLSMEMNVNKQTDLKNKQKNDIYKIIDSGKINNNS